MNSVSIAKPRNLGWLTIVSLALALWLGASLLMDAVVMPSMYWAGMMTESGFVTAGSTMFSIFNHGELLCAGIVLSGVLVLNQKFPATGIIYPRIAIVLATLLLVVPIVYLTFLSPEMSALGLNLDLFESGEVPEAMATMHGIYWALEVVKLSLAGSLLGLCHRT
jgi:hypothetical protein